MFWTILSLLWTGMHSCMASIMNLAAESQMFMILLSSIMALVVILHLKSASILLFDLLGGTSVVEARAGPVDHHYALRANATPYLKSPINILRPLTSMEKQVRQLHWNWYDQLPLAVLMENNGNTVIMRISCSPHCTPYLNGSDLLDDYYFVEAVFKWGTSEHRIDSRHYALELQALHAANQTDSPFQYLTVAYLFVLTHQQNKQLQQVVENLSAIRSASSMIELPPFDLASLMRPFDRSYYSYRGSYSNGSTVLPTQWFINTRICGVSSDQLLQFQALCAADGRRLMQNARREQPQENRRVQFIY